jgi:hypothetical protein
VLGTVGGRVGMELTLLPSVSLQATFEVHRSIGMKVCIVGIAVDPSLLQTPLTATVESELFHGSIIPQEQPMLTAESIDKFGVINQIERFSIMHGYGTIDRVAAVMFVYVLKDLDLT